MSASAEHFNQAATEWDKKPLRVQIALNVSQAIKQQIPLKSTMNAMDYGCGTGLVTFELASHLNQILGVDSAEEMLNIVTQKCAEQQVSNIKTHLADLTTDTFPQQSFDLIFSSMTFHHVKDTLLLMKQCFEHLNTGGWIAIADLDQEDGTFHSPDIPGVMHFGFEREEFKQQLLMAGFQHPQVVIAYSVQKETHTYPIFLYTAQKPL
jgi:ubiquinone/menaquinone biosynthesis C-methylase UbiE